MLCKNNISFLNFKSQDFHEGGLCEKIVCICCDFEKIEDLTYALNLMMEAGFSESPKILEMIVFRLSIHRQCQMWPEVLEDSIKAKEILKKTNASDVLNFMVTAQLGWIFFKVLKKEPIFSQPRWLF